MVYQRRKDNMVQDRNNYVKKTFVLTEFRNQLYIILNFTDHDNYIL